MILLPFINSCEFIKDLVNASQRDVTKSMVVKTISILIILSSFVRFRYNFESTLILEYNFKHLQH